ncbi:hypothetical protein GCM10023342_29650 [Modicisalibacter zincidurans]|uniref:Uncharacterized protein n=1 Tax=Modicisalibacter zincidurans TaxID=1178777 RepID=A0ABP9RJX6_9GAMM
MQRTSEHMAIIGVGQFKAIDQGFKTLHDGSPRMLIHQLTHPLEFLPCQIATLVQQVTHPLVVDHP